MPVAIELSDGDGKHDGDEGLQPASNVGRRLTVKSRLTVQSRPTGQSRVTPQGRTSWTSLFRRLQNPGQRDDFVGGDQMVGLAGVNSQRNEHTFSRLAQRLSARLERRRADIRTQGPTRSKRSATMPTITAQSAASASIGPTPTQRTEISTADSVMTGATEVLVGSHVLKLLSFGDDDKLLRGTSLAEVMRCHAAILADGQGSADTYDLSFSLKESEHLDAFISHNWCVPRKDKYAVLALHFNFDFGISTTFVVVGLQVLFEGQVRTYTLLSAVPVFFLAMYIKQDLGYWLGAKGPKCFLDKTCIHQTDPEMMKEGIAKLGAFLSNSKNMVVIYTSIYLKKLWTVYEIATFLAMRPNYDEMVIIPTFVPYVLAYMLLAIWVAACGVVFAEEVMLMDDQGVFLFCLHQLLLWVFNKYTVKLDKMHDAMENFDIQDCTCSNERDRPLVYANIAVLMRAMQAVSIFAGQEEALQEFNSAVKFVVPAALRNGLGQHIGIRYKHMVFVSVCFALPYLLPDWVCGFYTAGYCAFMSLAVGPALIAMTARLCSKTKEKPFWQGLLLKELGICAMWGAIALNRFLIEKTLFADGCYAMPSVVTIILIICVMVSWIVGALWMFLPGWFCPPKSDGIPAQSPSDDSIVWVSSQATTNMAMSQFGSRRAGAQPSYLDEVIFEESDRMQLAPTVQFIGADESVPALSSVAL